MTFPCLHGVRHRTEWRPPRREPRCPRPAPRRPTRRARPAAGRWCAGARAKSALGDPTRGAISGSLVERRPAFTLLRVSGTPIRALYRTVLLETILPLVTATVVAAGVGLPLAYPVARALAPQRHAPTIPTGSYHVMLGASLAIALGIIVACLPILGRITRTEQAGFD